MSKLKSTSGIKASRTLNIEELDEYKRDIPHSAITRRLYNPRKDPILITKAKANVETVDDFPARRVSIPSRKLYNPYGDKNYDWEEAAGINDKRNEGVKQNIIVNSLSSDNNHTRADESKNGNLDRLDETNRKDVATEILAKTVKSLSRKIMLMERPIIESSEKFTGKNSVSSHNEFYEERYWQDKIDAHLNLANKYFDYIHLSYSLAAKHDIEAKCWKLGFYSLIDQFRYAIRLDKSQSRNRSHSTVIFEQFGAFLNEAETFYKRLLKQIAADTKHNEKSSEKNKPPRWIRCVSCLGDITRYQWTYCLEDNGKNKDFWARNASRWYCIGIQLNSNNGKFYHHLAILAGADEFKSLYYFCRSLSVNTPFSTARESLVALFETNRLRFPKLNKQKPRQKQKARRNYVQKEKPIDIFADQSIENLFVRLHGMLFTKIGLDDFEQTFEIFLEKLCKWKSPQIANNKNETQWLECYLQMAVVNLSSMYNYGNNEGSFLGQYNSCANIDTDPTFSEKSMLTFIVMRQFMSNYLDSLLYQEKNDLSEGWLLYCEVVMLWMVADGIFDGFGDEVNKSIGMYICPNFWETLAKFLTEIAHQVSLLTKEQVLDNLSDEKPRFSLLQPPLNEDLELLGISWLNPLYESYLSECENKSHIKFDAYEIDNIINVIYNERNLSIEQDAKVRRRARIMELGHILSAKIIGFIYDAESSTFTSSPELNVEHGDSVTKESQMSNKFLSEENTLSERAETIEIEDEESEVDSHDEDDEEIKELKSRRQELENLLVASRSNSSSKQRPLSVSKVQQQVVSKKTLSRIVPGYTTLVVDTNCLVGDLVMVKKIICSDNWVVVVPLVVVTELDGLKLNTPPLGTAASEALVFLEQALSMTNKMRKIKIQTSKGNYVSGINYSEEFDFGSGEGKKKNMDDLILGICLWHAKNREENKSHESENNEVIVLLTNDRNLRVKARARGIDVIGAQDFSGLI
ncbi:4271_t:CDS:2 [Acaulospora morrowiae]|uniref:4271_t:CDS:1 n=1 Tax=Acaulospora morrowiae TaxID=94023 RepID=A0A9N9AYW9_9GLOM|nr:4271_t:CDS:2 [Acaulospora morrowiae]